MRRSFGPGMDGSGGGRGGGGMIKTVHRAIRAGIGGGGSAQEPGSHATTRTTTKNRNQSINTFLSLSSNTNPISSPCSYLNHHPAAPGVAPPIWAPTTGEEFDWEYIDGDGQSYDDVVYGSVPSKDEVYHALSSLQEVLDPVSYSRLINDRRMYGVDNNGVETILSPASSYTSGSELDWIEPSMQLCNSSRTLQVPSSNKVYDAFHLLQTEPSVQRMVISLSSDKAVWDAVMNNEVVRELWESVDEDKGSNDGVDCPNQVTQVLRWIFVNSKEKVIEIVEKITKIVNELVQPMSKDEKSKREGSATFNSFEEKLKSSLLLSIMVLLIIVVSRAHKS